ncbi:MAG: hypothetical protein ACREF3_00780 [Acetobacteraceae bacterium]
MARIEETDYEPGWGGGGVIIASVKLASTSDPAKVANILSVDTDGVDAKRPRVAWIANNVLQITAANLSYVAIDRREYDGVRIVLRFDPDDPATRTAWLKWLHTPRGHPSTVRFAAVPSPDGNWIAAVAEDNDGWEFSPDYPVTLTSRRDPADHARVLYIVSTEESRGPPRVSWTNADELQVTVPSRSYVIDPRREYQGVRIDLRFDPDDPAARSGGLKRQ